MKSNWILILLMVFMLIATCKKDPESPSSPNKFEYGQTTIDSVSYRDLIITTLISNLGGNTVMQYGHCWDTISTPDINDHLTSSNGNPSNLSIKSNLTGLNPSRKYFVRAYCKLSNTTVFSSQVEVNTLKTGKPLVGSLSITEITINSAKCDGVILSDSGLTITERGVCWDTVNIFTVSDCLAKMTNGTGIGSFSCQLNNLQEGKNYFIKAYAINQAGTSYGDLAIFQTISVSVPTVITAEVVQITSNSAVCGGSVTNNGNGTVNAFGICWNMTGSPTLQDNINFTVDGTGLGEFISILTNINYPVRYYVSAYATNEKGTAYGEERSFVTPIPCGELTIDYGEQTYHTIQIGSQCWLKENLNIGLEIVGSQAQTNNGIIEKYCYNDSSLYCSLYGGLYQWNEVLQYSTLPGTRGICPEGWHIPSDEEWAEIEGTADSQFGVGSPEWEVSGWRGYDAGKKLKAISSWLNNGNGIDEFEFSILSAGFIDNLTIEFQGKGTYSAFWTSNSGSSSTACYRGFGDNKDEIGRHWDHQNHGFSLRCIKD